MAGIRSCSSRLALTAFHRAPLCFPHDSTSPVFLQRDRPPGLLRGQPGGRCPEPGCAARAAQGRDRQRRARSVRPGPGRGTEQAPPVWLGGIRQPATQHRYGQQRAGAGFPQALQRSGCRHQLPQRLAAGGGQAPGLADAAGQLDGHLQCRPALRPAQCAPGHRQGRCAVGHRGAGDLAQHRQVVARCLRSGVCSPGCQGGHERRAALGAHRCRGRRAAARGDAQRRARAPCCRSRAGQHLCRLRRQAQCQRTELATQ